MSNRLNAGLNSTNIVLELQMEVSSSYQTANSTRSSMHSLVQVLFDVCVSVTVSWQILEMFLPLSSQLTLAENKRIWNSSQDHPLPSECQNAKQLETGSNMEYCDGCSVCGTCRSGTRCSIDWHSLVQVPNWPNLIVHHLQFMNSYLYHIS